VIPFPFNPADAFTPAELNGEGGFPHSEIVGSKVAHTSPTLIAACHVLHRLYMPRHPRIALTSRLRVHTTNDNTGSALRPTRNSAEQCSVVLPGSRTRSRCPERKTHPGVDDNLSLVSDGTSPVRTKPESLAHPKPTPPRHRFEKPIHNVKQRGRPKASRIGRSRTLSLQSLACLRRGVVEPIGIEPMT
jgi:hypothetical protein